MVDRLLNRLEGTIPLTETRQEDIADFLAGTGWSTGWSQSTLNDIARKVAEGREDPPAPQEDSRPVSGPSVRRVGGVEFMEVQERFLSPVGDKIMYRGKDGSFIGTTDNVRILYNDDGDIIGENLNTGTRKVIIPANEV